MKYNIKIPTSLNDVTLRQYQKFSQLNKDLENKQDSEIQLKIVEIFCNVPQRVVRKMKATDITEICQIVNGMFDDNYQLINRFKLNGVEYGFIPELDDMSFGEYMDLDSFIGDNDNLHRAMNVLFRPIQMKKGNRYYLKEYDSESSEVAKDFPMDVVMGSIVFFYTLGNELLKTLPSYLMERLKEMKKRLPQNPSQKNGVGLE